MERTHLRRIAPDLALNEGRARRRACVLRGGGTSREVVLVNSISGNTLEVEGLDSGLSFESLWEIQLGALSYAWTAGPYLVPLSGTLVIPVDIPDEALLDALAEDYLTDLRVRFEGSADGRVVMKLRSGPLFLAWPEGQQGAVRVWDEQTALTEAPKGVVDDAVRAEHVESDPSRVLAPIFRHAKPEPDPDEDREPEE